MIKQLKYYCFDFDDNILHLDTKVHVEIYENNMWKEISVSTSEYASIRESENIRFKNNNIENAFIDFSDKSNIKDVFLKDVIYAIKNNKYAPSWNKLLECLTKANLFAIITARAHEPDTLRRAIEYIIDNYIDKDKMVINIKSFLEIFGKKYNSLNNKQLINKYLDNCYYYGVTSDTFKQYLDADMTHPERAKEVAIDMFIAKVDEFSSRVDLKANIGFSDDDLGNISTIKNLFENYKCKCRTNLSS